MKDATTMMSRISDGTGFLAALDQSGGSTPSALRQYGIPDTAYSSDAEMFQRMHEMRVRVMTAPPFSGDQIIGAILFEGTMNGVVEGKPVPAYLWDDRHIVPFVKVDKGLDAEADGVRLMKPIPTLDAVLAQAVRLGVFGTKMRSVINLPSRAGILAIVEQQFDVAKRIMKHGLVPIVEPEVLISSPDKGQAEAILLDTLLKELDKLEGDQRVMLKLTIPERPDHYAPVICHDRIVRVVALSGGYALDVACERLAVNHGMIASFSRALLDGLKVSMNDAEFDAALAAPVEKIYRASTVKR